MSWRALGPSCSPASGRDPDEHTDRMVNIWNAYQCMVTFNMSRSASYSSPASGAAWASATPTRTCSASSTWFPNAPASGSSIFRPPSSRPAALTTSTSR